MELGSSYIRKTNVSPEHAYHFPLKIAFGFIARHHWYASLRDVGWVQNQYSTGLRLFAELGTIRRFDHSNM